jgi:His-Xaa-Ser system protein HxsD
VDPVATVPPDRPDAQETFDFRIEPSRVVLDVEERLFPLDVIYGAAYLFVDRCYVFLGPAGEGRVRASLRLRGQSDDTSLEGLAGEFANELLNQGLRHRLAQSTGRLRELYTARALGLAEGRSKIDQLLQELEAEEWEDDPLSITTPWEERSRSVQDARPEDPGRPAGAAKE